MISLLQTRCSAVKLRDDPVEKCREALCGKRSLLAEPPQVLRTAESLENRSRDRSPTHLAG